MAFLPPNQQRQSTEGYKKTKSLFDSITPPQHFNQKLSKAVYVFKTNHQR